MYITIEDFKKLGYTVDEKQFGKLGYDAEKTIDLVTFDRFRHKLSLQEQYKQELQHCVGALIDAVVKNAENEGITSFNNGKVSVSFGDNNKSENIQKKYTDICYRYLPVELLYPFAECWEECD